MLQRLYILFIVLPFVFGSPEGPANKVGTRLVGEGYSKIGPKQDTSKKGEIWAVLVAGSKGYNDYRHQADVCHAYQIFRKNGVPDENIIVMMYDDIAYNPLNPNPGVIINKPGGPNVYKHVPKDYTGDDVTSQNFVNVITGNKTAMKGIGSGKVLQSGPNDHVFINFVDRGSPGLVVFPRDYLYADTLMTAFKEMHKKKLYNKLLFYLESSHSGSMFDGLLPTNLNILAVSASKPDQGSFATYWSNKTGCYVADLFSVAWMEDIESEEHHKTLTTELLTTQYKHVVERTKGSSDPIMYGSKKIAKDHVTDFFGNNKKSRQTNEEMTSVQRFVEVVKSQDVFLHTLERKIEEKENGEEKQKLENELETLLQSRGEIEQLLDRIISHVAFADVKSINQNRKPLRKENMTCYKTVVDAFNRECVNINKNTFTLRHLYKFVNLCAADENATDQVLAAFKKECSDPSAFEGTY